MSLMSKLLVTILSLSSLVSANEAEVIKFLKKGIGSNPNIISLDIKVVNKIPLENPKGWEAYIVQLNGKAKAGDKTQPISQRSMYFVGGGTITTELHNLKTGERLSSVVSPKFNTKYMMHNTFFLVTKMRRIRSLSSQTHYALFAVLMYLKHFHT